MKGMNDVYVGGELGEKWAFSLKTGDKGFKFCSVKALYDFKSLAL